MSNDTYDRPDIDLTDASAGADAWEDREADDGAPYVLPPSQWSTHDVHKALLQALVLVVGVSAVLLLVVALGRLTL